MGVSNRLKLPEILTNVKHSKKNADNVDNAQLRKARRSPQFLSPIPFAVP